MTRKKTIKEPEVIIYPAFKSATTSLWNAAEQANKFHAEGYDVLWCFAVVVDDADGKPIQGVYMLARHREQI